MERRKRQKIVEEEEEEEESSEMSEASSSSWDSDNSPPPPKKRKSRGSEVELEETLEAFRERIANQRVAIGSALDFAFAKSRCKLIGAEDRLPESHSGIVYWMSRDQRVQDNWALIRAQWLALKEKVPLFVCFCLVPKFLRATLRQYSFMLKGLKLVHQELQGLNISFALLFGEPKEVLPKFVNDHKIGGIVTDFSPLRTSQKWVEEVSDLVPTIPVCVVDAHNVVPVWVTSDKLEYAARTIRPKIHDRLAKYLTDFPAITEHPYKSPAKFSNPFADWDELINFLEIDKSVGEVDWAKPGYEEALQTLKTFIDIKVEDYAEKRNNPNHDAVSNLSPWFHFGHISVARCILEVRKSPHNKGREAFIEEALVRRELSDNFCYYNENYDNLNGASDWAQKTLNDHRKDKRSPLFKLERFEKAKTNDDLWNAAQHQLRIEGKMHGFLRMYWAKKILEWSESPEKALEIAIGLNDKYSLDGNDPNGFVGIMWSICGVHDQGFQERTIFGKIRFMNYDGCKRKFKVKSFVAKYNELVNKLRKEKRL